MKTASGRRYVNQLPWQLLTGIALIALSVVLYLAQIGIFHAPRDTFFYFLQDMAFVPVQVLLVTLIIHRLLNEREKRLRLEKLNMVIGIFFSEAGTRLLTYFSDVDPKLEEIRRDLIVDNNWSEAEFARVSARLRGYDYRIDIQQVDLEYLRAFLLGNRDFLIRLLENPNLLEHESFTELLLAVFHLVEEFSHRADMRNLPDADHTHLTGDMKRVYTLLVHEWLSYMRHLKGNYPYLFSLAMRTNPFDQTASPIIQ